MLKVLLTLLLISNLHAETCELSSYQYGGKTLCFSKKHKAYLSENCLDKNCEALRLLERSKLKNPDDLTDGDSRHPGAKICSELGGKTFIATSIKTLDQLCLCTAQDGSVISCNILGMD